MSHDTVYTRTIRRAIETLGGPSQLALVLGTSIEEVKAWAAGFGRPPSDVFLKAIDIVAQGRFARRGAANS